MSISLARLLLSVSLWIGVMALRVMVAPLQLPARVEDSVFVMALLTLPLAGAILTIKAALKESRDGPHKAQALVATLAAVGLAIVGLFSGALIWFRILGQAAGPD